MWLWIFNLFLFANAFRIKIDQYKIVYVVLNVWKTEDAEKIERVEDVYEQHAIAFIPNLIHIHCNKIEQNTDFNWFQQQNIEKPIVRDIKQKYQSPSKSSSSLHL